MRQTFLPRQLIGGLVPSHRQQMERSRKRVMKAARNDYQQGLENQKARFGWTMVSQLTDGSPLARLRCACLHQPIQEAYYDVNNLRTHRFPFFFRALAPVSLLMLALDTLTMYFLFACCLYT